MHKTLAMMGVLALAAATAMAQSTTTSGQTTTPGQSGAGTSESSTSKSETGSGSLSASDRRFIETAASGGMAEVELGRLAAEKAQSPEVKAFGQMMIDDHSKTNDELKALASQKGVTLPADTDSSSKGTKARLEKLSGDEFDKAYMQQMLKDHKKDVADFEKQSKASRADSDVKSFASKALPTLQQHLQHAQQSASLGPSAGTSATSTTTTKDKPKDKDKNTPDPDHP